MRQMAVEPTIRAMTEAGTRMIEGAQGSVVQVGSGSRDAGAGVIWDAGGLVLTNDHVVAGRRPGGNVRVSLWDGRSFEAEVTRRSWGLDLALLRLLDAPGDLRSAPVGDSD